MECLYLSILYIYMHVWNDCFFQCGREFGNASAPVYEMRIVWASSFGSGAPAPDPTEGPLLWRFITGYSRYSDDDLSMIWWNKNGFSYDWRKKRLIFGVVCRLKILDLLMTQCSQPSVLSNFLEDVLPGVQGVKRLKTWALKCLRWSHALVQTSIFRDQNP